MIRIVFASFLLLAGAARLAQAQTQGAQSAAVDYKVGTVTIKFVGTANVNEQVIRANMQVREGADLDESVLDRDIRALYKTGLFEFIEIKREMVDSRTFNLVIEVTPKFRVLAIKFEGNEEISTHRLEKQIKTRTSTALDERQVKEDSEKIKEYYQKEGFNQAIISYTIDKDRSTGLGTIVYKIREGLKTRISDILFAGNAHFKPRILRSEMDTKRWWIFSWLTDSGHFKDDAFQDDLDKLRDFYRDHGFLDVEISEEQVVFAYPSPGKLIITIHVREGRQYLLGSISFSGNKLHSSRLLTRVVALYIRPGLPYSPTNIDKSVERIEDYYGKDGYLETRAKVIRKPNLATNNIDVEFEVDESEKFNVESIEIEGNTKTKSVVILRELILGPGDVFDLVRMKISKLRLQNLRYFDDVTMTPEDTNIPGRKNLRVALKEGRTGSLTFGAGYSTLERASVFAELQQTNFDLFNTRSVFQGDGQKFDLKVTIGQLANSASLSFEEPWFLQKALGLGFQLYREQSDYISNYYEEIDEGVKLYLRKRIFGLEATLAYNYEIINIDDINPTASSVIQTFAGEHRISKVTFQVVHDTRDKIVNTTRGNRIEIDTAVAGGPLGGTDSFYSVEFRGSQFFKIFDLQNQVLSLIARGAVIQNYGSTTVLPYYDAYYLGGPYDLRGFQYHEVSPRDVNAEPIGGKTYGFFSAEYTIDVVDPVRIAFFYDVGFVNSGAFDFNAGGYNDDFGIGIRMFVLGAPVSLDFGIPIKHDAFNDQGNQFNFSFGTRF